MTGGVVMVQGAALGAAFDLLFTSVIDASKKAAGFTSHLNRLNSTLSSIKPNFDDLEKLNIIMDRPPHETEAFIARLKEAELLISRCSKETLNQVVEHRMSSNAVVGNEGTVVEENGEISVVVIEG